MKTKVVNTSGAWERYFYVKVGGQTDLPQSLIYIYGARRLRLLTDPLINQLENYLLDE